MNVTTLRKVSVEQWLRPRSLAALWGLKEDSAERWVNDGTVPPEFVRYEGRRYIYIHPDVVPLLQNVFDLAHAERSTHRLSSKRLVKRHGRDDRAYDKQGE